MSKGISLFTQSKGITAFAAKGKVQIQAQSDAVEVIADQVLKLISAKSKVEIAAHDEILLTAKGSYTKINGKGIEHGTPKAFTWYTPTLGMPGPKRMPYNFSSMKAQAFSNRFDVYDLFYAHDFETLSYDLYMKDGSMVSGNLDEHGRTMQFYTRQSEKVTALVGADRDWGIAQETFQAEDEVS